MGISKFTLSKGRRVEVQQLVSDITSFLNKNKSKLEGNYSVTAGMAGHGFSLSVLSGEEYADTAIELFVSSFDSAGDHLNPELYSGITGVAFCLRNLVNRGLLNIEDIEELTAVDSYLKKKLEQNYFLNDFGLQSGWVGLGLYCLEAYENKVSGALENLDKIIDAIHNAFIGKNEFWLESKVDKKTGIEEHLCPVGTMNGIAGIISFLSNAYSVSSKKGEIWQLLDRSTKWLKSNQSFENESVHSSVIFKNSKKFEKSNLAWCYGDLAVAKCFMDAFSVLRDKSLYENVVKILNHSSKRKIENSGVTVENGHTDVTFCHGISGICHMYHRLYQITGSKDAEKATKYWLEELLKNKKEIGKNLIGFDGYDFNDNTGELYWFPSTTLLYGNSGIALVLKSFLEEEDTVWDRLLLTNIIN